MKFISKNPNLRVIIEPGIPGSHLTGQLARPGVSVKFQDGIVEVKDQSIVEKMLQHVAFNIDFISAEDTNGRDPYANTREEMEPVHVLSEIKYGHVEKSVSSHRNPKIPAQLEALINQRAAEIAKSMIPDILKSLSESAKMEPEGEKSDEGEKTPSDGPMTPLEKARAAKQAKKKAAEAASSTDSGTRPS